MQHVTDGLGIDTNGEWRFLALIIAPDQIHLSARKRRFGADTLPRLRANFQ